MAMNLATKQAVAAAATAAAIGLLLVAAELAFLFDRERHLFQRQGNEAIHLIEGAAARAAWNLDSALGREVVERLADTSIFNEVVIESDLGTLVARAEREQTYSAWPESGLGAFCPQAVPLTIDATGKHQQVGQLRLHCDGSIFAQNFARMVGTTLLIGLARAVLIAFAMVLVFGRLVTRPLLELAHGLARVDPNNLVEALIPVPAGHEGDEMGNLANHITGALERLATQQMELNRLATRDPLTGLANRRTVVKNLHQALSRAARSGSTVAVIFIDLNGFKNINDTLGHRVGDELLCVIGQRLTETVRLTDMVGRLGGDEFLVITEAIDGVTGARTLADRIVARVTDIVETQAGKVFCGASIGIALAPDDGSAAEDLLIKADLAMYAAKTAEGAPVHFFSKDLSEKAEERSRLERRLREAVVRDEFELFLQPKVQTAHLDYAGAEALIRWRMDGQFVSPAQFIPVAEQSEIVCQIGNWMVDRTCRWLNTVRCHPQRVAVNISARHIARADFVQKLTSLVQGHGVPPSLLELEITESILMRDWRASAEKLEALRRLGFTIAIDDFGTGYSSLAYLRNLPADTLKIDRAFISSLPHEPAIAKAVIEIAKGFGMHVVAEGVETPEQLEWLRRNDCDLIQGFLISKPQPATQFAVDGLPALMSRPIDLL